jgi:hypothetical protein
MAKKFAKWVFSGNSLSVGLKDKPVAGTLNMTEVWPGFDGLKEWQRFLIVYGIKQNVQDEDSATQGADKIPAMAGNLNKTYLEGLTFTRSGGKGGISYKAKLQEGMATLKEKEANQLRDLLIKAGMGGMLK